MPDVSGASAVKTRAHIPLPHSAHEAAGALGTRHSPRPLIGEGGTSRAKLGHNRPRDRGVVEAKRNVVLDNASDPVVSPHREEHRESDASRRVEATAGPSWFSERCEASSGDGARCGPATGDAAEPAPPLHED